MEAKIKAGIAGAAGYAGGELIRLLLNHPQVELHFIQSRSHAGQSVESVHEDLVGENAGVFSSEIHTGADVVFLCMGHGASKEFIQDNEVVHENRIIDLSQDFRLAAEGNDFIYGLPEMNRVAIRSAKKIANPGCFATGILLGLLPLAGAGLLEGEINITGITGSTGAGQSLSPTSHFSWRDNNLSVYKAFEHQHLHEIRQSIAGLQNGYDGDLNFIPIRGDFPRGIMVTTTVKCDLNAMEVVGLYEKFYNGHPFTVISATNPYLKQVANTNKALIHLVKDNKKLLVVSMIDNLLKGASGQAVQNMNLMFGLDETTGLKLKANAF